ncbi:hypothetical protein O9929_17695 [Vibrio lentus]|nr:hypothetical protein [Vibrio lentus]
MDVEVACCDDLFFDAHLALYSTQELCGYAETVGACEEGEVEAIVADDVVLKYMIGNGRISGQFDDSEVLLVSVRKAELWIYFHY